MNISKQAFGKTADGMAVDLCTLTNANGLEAKIATYGGIIVSLTAPDRDGKLEDVVLGLDTLEQYLAQSPYFGCITGRYANRIDHGKFTLNGIEYTLTKNEGRRHHLHGGNIGFDKKVWAAAEVRSNEGVGLKLSYLSPDGEENYPGNLSVTVTYTLTNDNALKIDYTATTDQDTVLNLTNHSYFNLAAGRAGDCLGHELMLNAAQFTPIDETLIPTGQLRSVKGTPLDFTTPTVIGDRIEEDYDQLRFGGGYDHNFVLDNLDGSLILAAKVREPITGRVMEVYTTEPAVQFYSSNFLDGSITGKGGVVYKKRYAFCLETQHYPDSPNKPNFPSTVLKPGQTYQTTTIYKFAAE
ncbi:MAG: galactose mutarotase [Anaerolineae bacterium]|nr:galactose mutarotase [Anaerolineae bacterium]